MSAFLLCVPFLFHALLPHDTRDADGPAESPPSHTFALGVSCWLTSFSTCFSELLRQVALGAGIWFSFARGAAGAAATTTGSTGAGVL